VKTVVALAADLDVQALVKELDTVIRQFERDFGTQHLSDSESLRVRLAKASRALGR
jgi:hypothetical protein